MQDDFIFCPMLCISLDRQKLKSAQQKAELNHTVAPETVNTNVHKIKPMPHLPTRRNDSRAAVVTGAASFKVL